MVGAGGWALISGVFATKPLQGNGQYRRCGRLDDRMTSALKLAFKACSANLAALLIFGIAVVSLRTSSNKPP
jgi:hypothetical protein